MNGLLAHGIALLLIMLPGAAVADRLRLAADDWPPFTGKALPGGGLATELVRTALTRAGYASEFQEVPWARAMRGLESGSYDALVGAWYSEARTRIGEFSEPYLVNRVRFLKRKGSPIDYQTLDDLLPFQFAVVRGYAYAPEFDQDPRLRKIPVHGFAVAARMLYAGRVSLTLEDELVARHYLNLERPEVGEALEFLPRPLSENGLHLLVARQHPRRSRIVADFNRQIAAMHADGTYAELLRRHGL